MNVKSIKKTKPDYFPAIKIRIRENKNSKGIIYKVKHLPVYLGNSSEQGVITLKDETLAEKEVKLVKKSGKIYLVNLTNKNLKIDRGITEASRIGEQRIIELLEGITELKLGKYLISIKIIKDTVREEDEDSKDNIKPKLTERERNIVLFVGGVLTVIVAIILLLFFFQSDGGNTIEDKTVIKMDKPKEVPPNKGDKFNVIISDKLIWDPGNNNLSFKIIDTTRSDFENYKIKLDIAGVRNRAEFTIKEFDNRKIIFTQIENGVKIIQGLYFQESGTRQSTLTVQRPGDDAIVIRKFTIITKKPPERDVVVVTEENPDGSKDNNENSDDSTNVTVDITEENNNVEVTKINLPPLPEGITFTIMPIGNSDTVVVKITFPGLIPFKIDKNGFNVGNGVLVTQGKMTKYHYIKYGLGSVPPKIQLKFAGYLNELRTYLLPEVETFSGRENKYLSPLPDGILVSLFPGGEDSKAIRITAPVEIEIDSLESVNGFCTTLGKKTKYHFITYDKPELVPATVRIKFKGYLNELRTYAVEK